jgi:hypothetical protein
VLAWFSGADKIIGVVRPGWFADKTLFAGTAAGVSTPFLDSTIIEQTHISGHTAAHEIAHTYFWVNPLLFLPEADPTSPFHLKFMDAPGYWVEQRCEMGRYNPFDDTCTTETALPFELMYKSEGSPIIADAWIGNLTFNYLLDQLKVNPVDPPVIGVSAIIFENNTTVLNPWYRIENGTLDRLKQYRRIQNTISERS